MLVNSVMSFQDLGLAEFVEGSRPERLLVVPAFSIAMDCLGRPLPGTGMLGGFAALSGAVSIGGVLAPICERFGGRAADSNVAAVQTGYAFVIEEREALTIHA